MTQESSARRTVLVIDEDVKVLDATRAILESAGYRVVTRERSSGSISVIGKEKPDVVLVELSMARLNGEMIAKILSKTYPRPHVAVLFHSSLPVETLRQRALAAGAQGYVQKTADPAEFLRRIEHSVAAAKSLSKNRMLAISLPDADAPHSPEPDRPPPEALLATRREAARVIARPGAVKTLFVDDDWSLLRTYRTTLSTELKAEFLTSGEEAAQRILSDSPPDIVVCDIIMPFVTGADLYSRAVAADSSWSERFLFLTGASSTRVVITFMNEHEGRVLFKPVPSNRLLDAIRKMESRATPRS
jgi:DNA-binding response OmpR family regulator